MDEIVGFYLLVSLLTTVLAVVLASLFMKLRAGGEKNQAGESRERQEAVADGEDREKVTIPQERETEEETGSRGGEGECKEEPERIPKEEGEIRTAEQRQQRGSEEEEEEEEEVVRTVQAEKHSPAQRVTVSSKVAEEEGDEERKEETHESEITKAMNTDIANDAEEEQFSFKYSPGKLRGSHFETMMTKEEREEEQRNEDLKLSLDSS